jgi:uncharacterized protein HemY
MEDRIQKIKAFLVSTPNDCFLNHALALEYAKAGDEQNAKRHFELNLAHDPSYVATYYHLGKLLERVGEPERAMSVYAKGMEQAKVVNDMHAFSELRAACDDLED